MLAERDNLVLHLILMNKFRETAAKSEKITMNCIDTVRERLGQQFWPGPGNCACQGQSRGLYNALYLI